MIAIQSLGTANEPKNQRKPQAGMNIESPTASSGDDPREVQQNQSGARGGHDG